MVTVCARAPWLWQVSRITATFNALIRVRTTVVISTMGIAVEYRPSSESTLVS